MKESCEAVCETGIINHLGVLDNSPESPHFCEVSEVMVPVANSNDLDVWFNELESACHDMFAEMSETEIGVMEQVMLDRSHFFSEHGNNE